MGSSRKAIFSYLRDRVWTRVKGWNTKQLSRAGKEVLIKAVLQAIPSYVMSCFLLPIGLLQEIESVVRRFWWGTGEGHHMSWIAWKKLCRPKEVGGMGFRDLRSFNLALIAKQAWRICTKPNMLLAQILRARYFSEGDFWTAHIGQRPSATWRSIISARPHILEGSRVRIGDGASTSIWWDPWIINDDRPKIITPRPAFSVFPDSVADLIDPTTVGWNTTLIEQWFWPVDIPRILSVPIGGPTTNDRLIWGLSNSGQFTVRTCYHNIMSRAMHEETRRFGNGEASGASSRDWKMIWQLPIPPKIRVFTWRACAEILPCKAELFRRKITSDPICPVCEQIEETSLHAVYGCKDLKKLWMSPPFQLSNVDSTSSYWSWVDTIAHSLQTKTFHLAVIVCWKLWERRNMIIHGERPIPVAEVVAWCSAFLDNYREAQFSHIKITKIVHKVKWTPPPAGVYKMNVDAAFPSTADGYLTSAIVRDADGRCIWWRVKRFPGRVRPVEGEAEAVRQALLLARSFGWQQIIIEGDSLQVMDALRAKSSSDQSFGAILENCFSLMSCFSFCLFSFIKRQGNSLAHELATLSVSDVLEGPSLPPFLAKA